MAQEAALEALRMCEEENARGTGLRGGPEVQQMVQEFRKRRDYACERFERIGGVRLPFDSAAPGSDSDGRPRGAFYLFPEVSQWMSKKGCRTSDELCMRCSSSTVRAPKNC